MSTATESGNSSADAALDGDSYYQAPTAFAEVGDTRFAYRRLGRDSGTPIVLINHFLGTLDTFDPAIINQLALTRSVVAFDNTGVGRSSGTAPNTIAAMAADAAALIEALGLRHVDLLGHSMGGEVAQQVAVERPDLVRRLVLVGTGPRGGWGMQGLAPTTAPLFAAVYEPQDLMWLPIFFSPSQRSQRPGMAYLERTRVRTVDRDVSVNRETALAHRAAAAEWGAPIAGHLDYLRHIDQPTLVVNGSNDIVIPTINSYTLYQELPNAQLILYPDSGHGAHFQYPEAFATSATQFLDA